MSKTIILNPLSQNFSQDDLVSKYNAVGQNTGNLVFVEAIKRQLNAETEINLYQPDTLDDDIVQEATSIVIPVANFISYGGSDVFFERFLNVLDRTSCSVTMIGLGAQAHRYFKTPKRLVQYGLTPTKIKFLKRMSERTTSIGIRGDFTAECLEQLGIQNYKVIGCPSFYQSLDGIFPQLQHASAERVQMTLTPGAQQNGRMLDWGIQENATWLTQDMGDIPTTVSFNGGGVLLSPKYRYKRFKGLQSSSERVLSYYHSNAKVFFTIEEWEAFYKSANLTFAFGSRFHGNMLALRNGIPTLWVAHDSRTHELTKTLHLPVVTFKEIKNISGIQELVEKCDYKKTMDAYPTLVKEYVSFLNENDINHKYQVKSESL